MSRTAQRLAWTAGAGARPPPSRAASAARSSAVAAERCSAVATSAGHCCATTHGRFGDPAVKAYPPTPSTPLASVVTRSIPSSVGAGKTCLGAAGTPSFPLSKW
eukprot:6209345-Pleurochrysis_carterae.AAC.1